MIIFTYIFRLIWFITLILIQVLICNHICIGGYATPFLYIYFILKLDSSTSRNSLMFWAFSLGFIIDLFSNTLGMNTIAIVLLAFLRPFLLRLFVSRDNTGGIGIPSARTMGRVSFNKYIATSVLLHHSVLLTIEFFSFSDIGGLFLRIFAGSLLTFIFIIAVDSIRKKE
ncbi:hypothetical protein EZS27_030042 [termite gut metagenome]|uniref:Rod shape-determining protein MreD n=1 Tax=termite gut metagenome TaxID=433724 RepID=A0A5J4QGV0_9ZZZZ